MIDNLILFSLKILKYLPGGTYCISSGGRIAVAVFILGTAMLLLHIIIKGKTTLANTSILNKPTAKYILFSILGFQVILIFATATIYLWGSTHPIDFIDYGNGNLIPLYRDVNGIISEEPFLGRPYNEYFVEMVSPPHKKVLYLGFLLNTIFCTFFLYIYIITLLINLIRYKKSYRKQS